MPSIQLCHRSSGLNFRQSMMTMMILGRWGQQNQPPYDVATIVKLGVGIWEKMLIRITASKWNKYFLLRITIEVGEGENLLIMWTCNNDCKKVEYIYILIWKENQSLTITFYTLYNDIPFVGATYQSPKPLYHAILSCKYLKLQSLTILVPL